MKTSFDIKVWTNNPIISVDSILKSRDIILPTKVRLVKAMVFSSGHVWVWELDWEESWVPRNWCFWNVVLERTLESPLDCKETLRRSVLGVHWKDRCWSWSSNTLSTWCKELTHLKRPQCCGRLRAGGERDNRGWDGWMASLTRWTWVWVDSGSWWQTRRPGSLGRKEWDTTEQLNWTELNSPKHNDIITCRNVKLLLW